MIGVPDYDNYVEHMRVTHPDQTPMTYEEFFRERRGCALRWQKAARAAVDPPVFDQAALCAAFSLARHSGVCAAVHHNIRTGDLFCRRAGKESHGFGDILRLTIMPQCR